LANKSVVLYQSIKVKNKWTMRRAEGMLRNLTGGSYYVSYYNVHRRMHFGTLAPLGPIVSSARARLRRGLDRAAVQDHRRRLRVASGELTQQRPQVFDDALEDAGKYPSLGLLVDRRPRRQIVRHKTPLIAGLDDVAKAIEHSPQGVLPLRRVLPAQSQIPRHKTPFLIAYVTRIHGLLRPHPSIFGTKQPFEK
jgi:hypothetical protein